jgi:hypothetical protein
LKTHGFSEAQLSGEPLLHAVKVRFYGTLLAVECIWDHREEALEVKIARLQFGEPLSDFAFDRTGRRVRDHLTQLLIRRGVRDVGLRKVPTGTALLDRWRSHLEDYARLLQTHGDFILKQTPDALD